MPSPYLEILRSSVKHESLVLDSSATLRETIGNIGAFYFHASYEIPAITAKKGLKKIRYAYRQKSSPAGYSVIQSHKYKIATCDQILTANQ